ncbi:flagellar basal body rod protein FlgF [Thorsellia kenyensis]|uniref:Flagellar basal-body rod protein FlgF n=1 Tax=Thorsellia kenyensis TaxID=1549888 RepID=A0ABV6CBR8_9GAMM
MDRAIYTAMSGASQTIEMQSITAQNLANVSTPGFKAQLAALRHVPVIGETLPTRSVVAASTTGFDATAGTFNYTGNPLDVALEDNGYLAIQTPYGEAYTRNGRITVDANNQLRINNNLVIGEGGPIEVPPSAKLSIGADGTISSLDAGGTPNTIGPIGTLKKVQATSEQLARGDDGYFRPRPGVGDVLPNDPNVRVYSGVIESSNVNATDAMVDMINHQRRFELQMKVISSVNENEQRANQLMNFNV